MDGFWLERKRFSMVHIRAFGAQGNLEDMALPDPVARDLLPGVSPKARGRGTEDRCVAERRLRVVDPVEPALVGDPDDGAPGWDAVSEGRDEVGVEEVPFRFQDARHLFECLLPVGDVVGRIAGENKVELVVGERELARARGHETGVGRPLAVRGGRLDLLGVDVDAGDYQVERLGQANRHGAVATADVEQSLTSPGVRRPHEFFGARCGTGAMTRAVHEPLLERSHLHSAIFSFIADWLETSRGRRTEAS
jgi:hypothetical protein